jgi:hypothetical protein
MYFCFESCQLLLVTQEIFQLEVLPGVELLILEMVLLNQLLWLFQVLGVALSEVVSFELLEIVSQEARAFILRLKPHVRWDL